jgi:hypothetical protein
MAVASDFTLVFSYEKGVGSIDVRVSIQADANRDPLGRLERAVRMVVEPTLVPSRIPRGGERLPAAGAKAIETDEENGFSVRTNRVELVVRRPGPTTDADRTLARRLAKRLDREIASVRDDAVQEYDRVFGFVLKKGGFQVAETPVGGGFTSPWLAEVPAEVEVAVQLRTVETDHGGVLDQAVLQRMFEISRKELPDLERKDGADAIGRIGPEDWVLAQSPS